MAKSNRTPKTKTKSVVRVKRKSRLIQKGTLRSALVAGLKATSGRGDLKFDAAPVVAAKAMNQVPVTERAGYPVKRAKGSVDPKDWRTEHDVPVMVDFARHAWLPDEWGQGVKITKPTSHSTKGGGGTYTVMLAPDGKVFYHRGPAEEYWGKPFSLAGGFNGQVRLAQLQARQAIQLARLEIKEASKGGPRELIGTDPDPRLFKLLSPSERRCLAGKDEFHFCVVSARRATKLEGVRDIMMVQSQLLDAGVTPTWYVDEASLKDYRALGLNAVVGGKLTAARNKALDDARRKGKVCVQLSDDISAWEYRDGKQATERSDDALNAAHAAAARVIVSPVAAARFILAKMRGAEGPKPKLGGVYMLGSCGRTFGGDGFQRKHFILGDFFVADKSSVRFDEEMTLKEDYDFTCAHISAHGSVMRCNRMTLNVKHYANAGGACTNRDDKGLAEKRNVDILLRKWPGAFRAHPRRKGEVVLQWKCAKTQDDDAASDDDSSTKTKAKKAAPKKAGAASQLAAKAKAKKTTPKKAGAIKKTISKKPSLPLKARVSRTEKKITASYIAERCRKAAGKSVGEVLDSVLGSGKKYSISDLKYDLAQGYLKLTGASRQ